MEKEKRRKDQSFWQFLRWILSLSCQRNTHTIQAHLCTHWRRICCLLEIGTVGALTACGKRTRADWTFQQWHSRKSEFRLNAKLLIKKNKITNYKAREIGSISFSAVAHLQLIKNWISCLARAEALMVIMIICETPFCHNMRMFEHQVWLLCRVFWPGHTLYTDIFIGMLTQASPLYKAWDCTCKAGTPWWGVVITVTQTTYNFILQASTYCRGFFYGEQSIKTLKSEVKAQTDHWTDFLFKFLPANITAIY